MPSLAKCLGKTKTIPPEYQARLLSLQKEFSLNSTMKDAAIRAIDQVQKEVGTEINEMLGRLGMGQSVQEGVEEILADRPPVVPGEVTPDMDEKTRFSLQDERAGIEQTAKQNGTWPFDENGVSKTREYTKQELMDLSGRTPTSTQRRVVDETLFGSYLPITQLNPHDWVTVRTKAFKDWFGDWENDPDNASKVMNPLTREPQPQYHGSRSFRDENGELVFDPERTKELQVHFGTQAQARVFVGNAANTSDWLADPSQDPFSFGEFRNRYDKVFTVFLNVRRPLVTKDIYSADPTAAINLLEFHGFINDVEKEGLERMASSGQVNRKSAWRSIISYLRRNGYDGITYHNQSEGPSADSRNIAWATWDPEQVKSRLNQGTFSFDRRAMYSSSEEVEPPGKEPGKSQYWRPKVGQPDRMVPRTSFRLTSYASVYITPKGEIKTEIYPAFAELDPEKQFRVRQEEIFHEALYTFLRDELRGQGFQGDFHDAIETWTENVYNSLAPRLQKRIREGVVGVYGDDLFDDPAGIIFEAIRMAQQEARSRGTSEAALKAGWSKKFINFLKRFVGWMTRKFQSGGMPPEFQRFYDGSNAVLDSWGVPKTSDESVFAGIQLGRGGPDVPGRLARDEQEASLWQKEMVEETLEPPAASPVQPNVVSGPLTEADLIELPETPEFMTPADELANPPLSETRFSFGRNRMKGLEDFTRDDKRPNINRRVLAESTRMQASITPDLYVDRVRRWEEDPASTQTDRDAARLLRHIRQQGELKLKLPRMTPASASAEPASKTHGSNLILNETQWYEGRRKRFGRDEAKAVEALKKALENDSERILQEGAADALEGDADELIDNWKEVIALEAVAAKAAGNTTLATLLTEQAGRMAEFRRGQTLAVAGGLLNIVKEIPATALATPAATVAWIRARQANKSLPRLFSDVAFDGINLPMGARKISMLDADPNIHTKLARAKNIIDNAAKAVADIRVAKARLGKIKTVRQFAKEFHDIMSTRQDIVDALRMQSRALKRAMRRLAAVRQAADLLDELVQHPDYLDPYNEAVDELNAIMGGVKYIRQEKDEPGEIVYFDPTIETSNEADPSDQVVISLDPSKKQEDQNRVKRQTLMDHVAQWINTKEAYANPLLRNAWEQELSALQTWQHTGVRPALPGTMYAPGMNFPALTRFLSNPLHIARLPRKFLQTLRNLARELGGDGGAELSRVAQAWDDFEAFTRKGTMQTLQNQIGMAFHAAAKAHGFSTDAKGLNQYRLYVYEPLLASNQNPVTDPLKLGLRVNGYEILPSDIKLATLQTEWKDHIYHFIQTKDSWSMAMVQTPILEEETDKRLLPGRAREEEPRFRKASRRGREWMFKAPRTNEELGSVMVQRWNEAARLDATATATARKTDPNAHEVIGNRRNLLQNDDELNRMAMLGMMYETNPDWGKNPYLAEDETDRRTIIEESRIARPAGSWAETFDGITERMGELIADRVGGLSAANEAEEFGRRAIGYITKWMNEYREDLAAQSKEKAQVTSENVVQVAGASPFTKVRRGMVAPSPFYTYSYADDRSQLQLQEQVNIAFRKHLIVLLDAMEKGHKQALQEALAKSDDLTTRRERHKAVRGGKESLTIGQLEDSTRAIQTLRDRLHKLNIERAELTADDPATRTLRSIGSTVKMGVLSAFSPIINNFMQAGVASVFIAHALGSTGMQGPLPTAFTSALRTTLNWLQLHRVPIVGDVLKAFSLALSDPELAAAMAQGLGTPWNVNEVEAVKRLYPETGGVPSNDPKDRTTLRWVNANPVTNAITSAIRQGWGHGVMALQGQAEQAVNFAFVMLARSQIGAAVPRILNHVREFSKSGPGWEYRLLNDLSKTTRAAVGSSSDAGLNYWRNLMRPLGGLEKLMLDFHERTKGMSDAEAVLQPFLSPEQLVQVGTTLARDFNKKAPSGEVMSFIGKGATGLWRNFLGTFMRVPIQAGGASAMSLAFIPGESEEVVSRYGRFLSVAMAVLILALLGVELKQEGVQEALYNAGRSVRAPGDIETLPQLASYIGAMASPWGSVIPSFIQQASGEQSVRPIADFSELNLMANVVSEANRLAIDIAQTKNVVQPSMDFLERFFPMTRVVTSRVGRAGEAQIRSATRALRFAAPPGVESRRAGGRGSNKTTLTPVMRNLAQAVALGDDDLIRRLMAEAVKIQQDNGYSPEEALRSVQKSLGARSPVQRAFPRRLDEGELDRTISALRPGDRERVSGIQRRFDALTRGPRTGSRRGRRSALRSRRRRSVLGRASSFRYV